MSRKELAESNRELFSQFLEAEQRAKRLACVLLFRQTDVAVAPIDPQALLCTPIQKFAYCAEGLQAVNRFLDEQAWQLKQQWHIQYQGLSALVGAEFEISTEGQDYAILRRSDGRELSPGVYGYTCYWSADGFQATIDYLSDLFHEAAIAELTQDPFLNT